MRPLSVRTALVAARCTLGGSLLVAAACALGATDTQDPELRSLTVQPGPVNAARPGAQGRVAVQLRDDLSGLESVSVVLRDPAGRWSARSSVPLGGALEATLTVAIDLPPGAAAGDWQVVRVVVRDQAFRSRFYEAAELAGFGDTHIQVRNDRHQDATAPVLVRGQVDTPVVHPPKPGDTFPTGAGRVRLVVEDAGEGLSSGVASAQISFCHPTTRQSVTFSAPVDAFPTSSVPRVPGDRRQSLLLSGWAWGSWPQPVNLPVCFLNLADATGNSRLLVSVLVGGETDFSTLFPQAWLAVEP